MIVAGRPSFRNACGTLLGGAALLLVPALHPRPLAGQSMRPPTPREPGRHGLRALQQDVDFDFMDVNDVLLVFESTGRIGQGGPFLGVGLFPANSSNNYLFGSGLWVGAVLGGQKQVSEAYDPALGASEFNPGRADGSGGGEILCSDDPSDLARWYPEFSDATTGRPIVFSPKDCVVIYNDSNQAFDVHSPMGLEVRQRTMAFTFGLLSQVVFVVWDIVNEGSRTLEDAFVGISADMDIGDFDGDRCSAIPVVPPGPNNPTRQTAETNLGFCWDNDFIAAKFNPSPPGFMGITFFQGPVDEAGDTLGLTRFTLVTNSSRSLPQPDPGTDAEQYDLLAGLGTRAPFIDVVPADVRFVEISGPITLRPGEVQRVAAGYLWADVSHGRDVVDTPADECFPQGSPCFLPNPNDPALEELIRVQRAAQEVYDAGFLVPGPPPKPDVTLIPGDHQVTVAWSDVSKMPDPFFAVASDSANGAFDPLFRQFDFQGYVVVRSTSGRSDDVDTLAVFDLADDVTAIDDTTFQQFAIGDSTVTLATDVTPILRLPNQGLQFSFTDRGLINGITYFYDVVPFDFNPSNTLRGETISRSGGISFQPAPVKSARPRSDASSFRPAAASFVALRADGALCDTNEATATVDAATGHYTDFLDCSNAIVDARIRRLRDVSVPTGDLFFVVDSILPNDRMNPYHGGYDLGVGFNRVWFHWEREDGSLATEMKPAVGSFDQNFDFSISSESEVGFTLDTDPGDVGGDLDLTLEIASDFSVLEDLEVNGRSLHLEELGASAHNERRPHRIDGSRLARSVILGNVRLVANAREYANPGVYAQGGASYELTWSVGGSGYSGTLRKLPGGEVVPPGGQPKGPENPSTPGDFIAGYNWGFLIGSPEEVRAKVSGGADVGESLGPLVPLTNAMDLKLGDTFALVVPGQSVYVEGIQELPRDGDVWRILIDTGSDRSRADPCGGFATAGREPCGPTPPFSYEDVNDGGNVGVGRGIVNVYPGMRWRLSVAGGSNDPADADLERIKTVPNPYVVNAVWDFSQDDQRLEFTHLPPACTIRIYTISGNLVRVLEHTNGSGTEVWDLQTRFRLKAASGTYYWHVTTPDGRTKLGLLSIIQGEPAAN